MKWASVGFRVHSGWAAAVSLCGPLDSPAVVDRRRIQLVKTFTYAYRQPYHSAEKMPSLDEAAEFIKASQTEARQLARDAIRNLQKVCEQQHHKVAVCAILLASGRPLPKLQEILASHALIHTADGEHFRNALLSASEKCRLPVVAVKERELYDRAVKVFGAKREMLERRVNDLGCGLGPPWSQDEKLAALAAWHALAS